MICRLTFSLLALISLCAGHASAQSDDELVLEASALSTSGQFQQADSLFKTLLPRLKPGSRTWCDAMDSYAGNVYYMGDIMGSLKISEQVLAKCGDNDSIKEKCLFHMANCLGTEIERMEPVKEQKAYLQQLKDRMKAIMPEYMALVNKNYPKGSEEYFNMMLLAICQKWYCGEKEASLALTTELEQTLAGLDPELQAAYMDMMAMPYIMQERYEDAYRVSKDVPLVGNTLFDCAHCLGRAESLLGLGRKREAQPEYAMMTELQLNDIKKNFVYMSEMQRNRYWGFMKLYIYDIGKFVDTYDIPAEFAGTVYDLSLFSKGLELNSTVAVEKALANADAETKQQWEQIVSLRQECEQMPDSAKLAEAEQLEQQLMAKCKPLKALKDKQNVSWKDIKASLKDDAAAIEFIEYLINDTTAEYAAVVTAKKYQYPVVCKIGNADEIDNKFSTLSMTNEVWKKVWGTIAPQMEGLHSIYFSPVGTFCKYPIEYLPLADGSMVADKYDMHRVSSTSTLVQHKTDEIEIKDVALIGAPLFNSDTKATHRSGESSLPYSKKEIEYIDALLVKNKVSSIKSAVGQNANKVMLKEYTEAFHPNLLHVSTHAFCDVSATAGSLYADANAAVPIADAHLRKTGILLSSSSDSDERLTAKDMSQLDMSSVDLAVMSACNTAGGYVSPEGVYGLQRGLKLAGVKSIMMSTWKVSDAATKELMVHFYTHLLASKNPRKAILDAIHDMQKSDKYNDYIYWAPFILLD